ncbi:MAG: hypothetical protein AABY22_29885 [Nanoarchaeota archaeon]
MSYYWRFKGEKVFRYGWASKKGDLVMMGLYNGDYNYGPIVDVKKIEYRKI